MVEMDEVKLVVDAMGGDQAPGVVLEGVAQAVSKDPSIKVLLTGIEDVVAPFAAKHGNVIACPASQTIDMWEHPAQAVRAKKDSSIVVGCKLVKDGEAQGFFSAGSTGAFMAAATLVIGRVKGVKRPAIVTVLPSPVANVVFTDMGANADCKPEYLVQFAQMGRVYAQATLGIEDPTVGLLNIGEEETKGSEFAQECFKLMKEQVPNFKGNAEGRNLAMGGFDVIVTDGFTGNIALKVYEGVGMALLKGLKETIYSTTKSKMGGLLIKDALKGFKEGLSADKYGGAQLLGCKGVVLIGHGSSNPEAICNGVLSTASAIRMGMPQRLEKALAASGEDAKGGSDVSDQ